MRRPWIVRLWDLEDRTVPTGPVLGAVLVFGLIGLEAYDLYRSVDHHFDAQAFGIGAAALVGAINSANWLAGKQKSSNEPPQPGAQ